MLTHQSMSTLVEWKFIIMTVKHRRAPRLCHYSDSFSICIVICMLTLWNYWRWVRSKQNSKVKRVSQVRTNDCVTTHRWWHKNSGIIITNGVSHPCHAWHAWLGGKAVFFFFGNLPVFMLLHHLDPSCRVCCSISRHTSVALEMDVSAGQDTWQRVDSVSLSFVTSSIW